MDSESVALPEADATEGLDSDLLMSSISSLERRAPWDPWV